MEMACLAEWTAFWSNMPNINLDVCKTLTLQVSGTPTRLSEQDKHWQ